MGFLSNFTVLFFGFTNCPDVCPTTLATLAQVIKSLGKDADKVQVLMITVDPERDIPEVMSKYAPAFHPQFVGLVPTQQQLNDVIKGFKLYVRYGDKGSDGFYTVDHTASAYVLDTLGRTRLYVRHEFPVEDWVNDLRTLLNAPE